MKLICCLFVLENKSLGEGSAEMRKYIAFAISFIVLFTVFQYLSGFVLTKMYNPETNHAWMMSGPIAQETIIKSSSSPFMLTLSLSLLAASISYFVPKKLMNKRDKK